MTDDLFCAFCGQVIHDDEHTAFLDGKPMHQGCAHDYAGTDDDPCFDRDLDFED